MNKFILLVLTVLSCITTFAQDRLLGAAAKTNVTVVSNYEILRARKLFPLMKDEEGEFVNDGGIVGDKISTDAIDQVAEAAAEMAEAANTAMTNALQYVYEAMKDMARDSVGIAMAFAPEGEPSNLTVYVAHEYTNGTNDTFFVWFSEELALAPNLFMAYEYYGGCVTQKMNWTRGWNTVTNIVDNRGRTWEGCHIGVVERPTWAINVTHITEPNIPIGGPAGMNWGGITILDADDGEPYFTGLVTNDIDNLVMYIEDGAIKGIGPTPIGSGYLVSIVAASENDALSTLINTYGAKFIKVDGSLENMTVEQHSDIVGIVLFSQDAPTTDAVVVDTTNGQAPFSFSSPVPASYRSEATYYIQFESDTTISVKSM